MGWNITALDIDTGALFGGQIEFPAGHFQYSPGLIGRLQEQGLSDQVEIIRGDLYDFIPRRLYDTIFTSCSWHYSRNHDRPVKMYIAKMQACVKEGGIFCAEYMMPVEAKHLLVDHYMQEGQLRKYFPSDDWTILEEFYTPPFVEKAHIGNMNDHIHRIGFLMAQRITPPT